ncbi:putative P-loop containing nucleoside triphosphate hydrolase, leucine-rich repeat domain, L [Medicago truncatula]|uniref:Putative P-loop containing nucleoside triphosphate hydrolase, leucine-rich repeat domain, L n=1 Tax=Medicago truncatula TaxID=3880 RepID=A0A396JJD6_MEDTR|nr:putative disease resistance RPP13-like protein 1 [Medicago truncatula]RHN78360.1 putative P-loop containing nucleoside triphosphate hydrolase, leucine-rich repeat domain, L [Medicago truncatula]
MASVVAEAFLSAFVEVLLEKMISTEFVNFIRSKKLDISLLEKLKLTLLSLQAVLNDAEEKQITNPAVKQWLGNLRDVVFEADDLLDKINTEALRSKVNKVRNILSSNFKQSYGLVNFDIQRLFERLEHFARKGHVLGLKEGVSCSVWNGTPTSSVLDESAIYGRDGDRKKLQELLLHASDDGNKIGVISIVGMGGLGKTTLAKLLYNDPEVKEKFDLKGWAYISKDFDIVRVTKTLLESVTFKTIDANNMNTMHTEFVTSKITDTGDLNTLQVQLQQSLIHKRFLLVLDDMWDGSYVDWNNLKDIFNVGEMGSKIIITTRDERVALVTQTFLPIHYLAPMQSDECWSLLSKHAFGASNYRLRSNLEAIGKEIAKKCDGLPLAAVALGGLLRTKLSQDDWNDVLKSNIWNLPNVGVQQTLLSSYHYLPAPLKRCFAYCSIFPKNSILQKNMVVQLWMAEGLVHKSKRQKSWEKVGEEYFDELVSRSLIRRRYIDGEECYEMHDLVNDLATMVSSPYCIKLDEHEINDKVRHLSCIRRKYDSYSKFDKLNGLKGLRTFLVLPLQEPVWLIYSISDRVVRELLPAMKQLRVLSLSNYRSITELPNSIGNLICLRYLNLSNTAIERLPSVTCNLYNLLTLLLFGCWCLVELPEDIVKLVNLRHLDIRGTQLKEMPVQITRLQNLQTLSDFAISNHRDGLKVRELGKFPHLKGNLSISNLQNITDPFDAFEANLKMKEQIDNLELQWILHGSSGTTSQSSQIQALVLQQLQPSTNLKNLTIKGYGGTSFPNWLGDSLFSNMVYLHISGCDHCSLLPPLGQLHGLKKLSIASMKSVKSLGSEFYGNSSCPSFQPFPSLETLEFEEMLEWEEWNLTEATKFPSLTNLSLETCSKLKGNMPCNLPSLTTLELKVCDLLLESRHSDDQIIQSIWSPLNSLRQLTLVGFPSLMSFPRDGLPKTLQSLTIHDCENLKFLPCESLHNYSSLEDINIFYSCNSAHLIH